MARWADEVCPAHAPYDPSAIQRTSLSPGLMQGQQTVLLTCIALLRSGAPWGYILPDPKLPCHPSSRLVQSLKGGYWQSQGFWAPIWCGCLTCGTNHAGTKLFAHMRSPSLDLRVGPERNDPSSCVFGGRQTHLGCSTAEFVNLAAAGTLLSPARIQTVNVVSRVLRNVYNSLWHYKRRPETQTALCTIVARAATASTAWAHPCAASLVPTMHHVVWTVISQMRHRASKA